MIPPQNPNGPIYSLFRLIEASDLLVTDRQGNKIEKLFGEENIMAQIPPPRVVVVPTNGTYSGSNGYVGDGLNSPRVIWEVAETIELHVWGRSNNPDKQTPLDHTNETELLKMQVLQAIHQQMFLGYFYKAVSHTWVKAADVSVHKYGRVAVLLISASLPVTMPPDEESEVISISIATALNT